MITDEAMKQPILSAKKVTMSDTSISFQPVSGAVSPRFAGVPTFMRVPYQPEPEGLDIALIGVPYDGAVTNRAGARIFR